MEESKRENGTVGAWDHGSLSARRGKSNLSTQLFGVPHLRSNGASLELGKELLEATATRDMMQSLEIS